MISVIIELLFAFDDVSEVLLCFPMYLSSLIDHVANDERHSTHKEAWDGYDIKCHAYRKEYRRYHHKPEESSWRLAGTSEHMFQGFVIGKTYDHGWHSEYYKQG